MYLLNLLNTEISISTETFTHVYFCKEIRKIQSTYLDFIYVQWPLISKWKSGPCFKMEIEQQVTKHCGKEKLLLRSNFSSFPQYFQYTVKPVLSKHQKESQKVVA